MPQLPGVNTETAGRDDRDQMIRSIRDKVLDLVGPTYILDRSYHFVDWNPSFEELIARPLRLARGQHVETFVRHLSNETEVVNRSIATFACQDPPQVDTEALRLVLPEFGGLTFRKVAAQIPDDEGEVHGWSVHLILIAAEREEHVWSAVTQRLEHEVTWSKYAVVYDRLLLHFTDYRQLLEDIACQVDGAQRCLDLGAGTGNSSLALLERDATRMVWAIDSNEIMLRQLRRKTEARHAGRLFVIKDDVHALPGFADHTLDAATMV